MFPVQVSDGGLRSVNILKIIIVIFVINPVNEGLTLDEGAQAYIMPTSLSAYVTGIAEIASSEFVFNITRLPQNGSLEVAGLPVNGSVSLEDIEQNRLAYIHDGSDTVKDSFLFDVIVRNFTKANQIFAITIVPVDDTAPSVEVLEELRVLETERGYLSKRHLQASDSEQQDRELKFDVLSPPKYGTLYRRLSPNHRWVLRKPLRVHSRYLYINLCSAVYVCTVYTSNACPLNVYVRTYVCTYVLLASDYQIDYVPPHCVLLYVYQMSCTLHTPALPCDGPFSPNLQEH